MGRRRECGKEGRKETKRMETMKGGKEEWKGKGRKEKERRKDGWKDDRIKKKTNVENITGAGRNKGGEEQN